MTNRDTTLPGLEPPQVPPSPLERAVRVTLEALAPKLSDADAARLALAIELAQIIDVKKRAGRLSTVANDARVLMDLLSELDPPDTAVDDELAKAMARWSEALEGSHGE